MVGRGWARREGISPGQWPDFWLQILDGGDAETKLRITGSIFSFQNKDHHISYKLNWSFHPAPNASNSLKTKWQVALCCTLWALQTGNLLQAFSTKIEHGRGEVSFAVSHWCLLRHPTTLGDWVGIGPHRQVRIVTVYSHKRMTEFIGSIWAGVEDWAGIWVAASVCGSAGWVKRVSYLALTVLSRGVSMFSFLLAVGNHLPDWVIYNNLSRNSCQEKKRGYSQ